MGGIPLPVARRVPAGANVRIPGTGRVLVPVATGGGGVQGGLRTDARCLAMRPVTMGRANAGWERGKPLGHLLSSRPSVATTSQSPSSRANNHQQ